MSAAAAKMAKVLAEDIRIYGNRPTSRVLVFQADLASVLDERERMKKTLKMAMADFLGRGEWEAYRVCCEALAPKRAKRSGR